MTETKETFLDLFKEVQELSRKTNISNEIRLIKLQEEVGELAAAHLAKINSPNKSQSATDNTLEEAVDVLINLMDYIGSIELDELKSMIQQKTNKFKNKIKNFEYTFEIFYEKAKKAFEESVETLQNSTLSEEHIQEFLNLVAKPKSSLSDSELLNLIEKVSQIYIKPFFNYLDEANTARFYFSDADYQDLYTLNNFLLIEIVGQFRDWMAFQAKLSQSNVVFN